MHQVILAFCLFAAVIAYIQPNPPVWPNQWQSNFIHETNDGVFGKGSTNGTVYYDWTNRLYRIDRATGKRDKYCGSVKKLKDTPCSHIIVDDMRYIYYPELKYCCACCTAKEGCGLLLPTWMENATYVGQTTLNQTMVDEWDIKGFQSNYYYEIPNSRVPVEIFMSPTDAFVFDASSFKSSIADPNVFKLPSICDKSQSCPKISACGIWHSPQ